MTIGLADHTPSTSFFRRGKTFLWISGWIALAVLLSSFVPLASDPDRVATLPLSTWISGAVSYLLNDVSFFGVPLKTLTRDLANIVDVPGDLLRGAMATGFEFDLGQNYFEFEPMSWIGLVALLIMTTWWIGGRGLGVFSIFLCAFLLIFDLWGAAATTLASIALAVPLAVGVGLLLGILANRNKAFQAVLIPVLDLMQTVPVFAYLLPMLLLFGLGPASAVFATIIYATPPMVRATMTGLEKVPSYLFDLSKMVGASARTETWQILVPSARPLIMVGVNQVILNSLNMVTVASMIGAGGLGFEVLDALRKLQIGHGAEAGMAITLLAVLLDQLSQKISGSSHKLTRLPRWLWLSVAVLAAVSTVVGQYVPEFAHFPNAWTTTTQPLSQDVMNWLNLNAFDTLETFKVSILTYILFPIRDLFLALPWAFVMALSAWAGVKLGGIRLALLVLGLEGFILFAGIWDLAMITLYLCGTGVLLAFVLGSLIAVATFRNTKARTTALFVADLLQTMPSFVYLIPVVMLFRVGDFAAIIAVAAYAIAPAIRYTIHGLVSVPVSLTEAAFVSGCTNLQKLIKVELPMAIPELLLGLNQAIMMGLAMVVITALVGTNDLGQEVYIALAKVDPGRGIVAGLGVAFIAIILDRLIVAAAADYRRKAIG